MEDQIKIEKIGGIKCDNPLCDYRDETVDYREYKEWINRPCPKCGANLLTKADYRAFKRLLALLKVSNFIAKALIKLFPKKYEKMQTGKMKYYHADWNGTGNTYIKEIEK